MAWFAKSSKGFDWQEEPPSWGLSTKPFCPWCFEQSVAAASNSLESVMLQNKSVGGRGC